MSRILGLVAALVAALALGACGGDEDKAMSKEDYKKEAQSISDKIETDFQGGIKNAQSKDPAEALTGVKQIGSASTEASDKLDKLEEPEEYKDVHGRLVGSLRTLGQRADAVEQAAEAEDKTKIDQSLETFNQSIQEVDRVGTEFDKKVGTT